jgi:thioredoxin-dependent peroxiredoxin
MISIGQTAPDFCLIDKDEKEVCLKDFRGKWVVLYFYPKDNTAGCTLEAIDFSSLKDEFRALNAEVLGVSVDSAASHRSFAEKHSLTLTLLSDADRRVVSQWGVWGKKKLYGKQYEGTTRSTFLIDPNGTVREVWNKVGVKDHAAAVLERLRTLR